MISFAGFLRAVRGHEPYPWQERLAARCAAGAPPAAIAVPTGCGKTTTVDALVWALACQAERPAADRTVGVRIVWAIDRRIVVDEVHEHATQLAQLLTVAADDPAHVLHELAGRLSALGGGDGPPLAATRWRGGIDPDRALLDPLQPQIVTSTVAQVASRLLFRGYGVSDLSRALAAGTVAADTTICLDEAHLAGPFRQTVDRIRAIRAETEQKLTLPQLSMVTITATPDSDDDPDTVVSLDQHDRAHPELRRRLDGRKRATLVEPAGTTDRERVGELVAATLAQLDDGADSVACVVNTVKCARDVHRSLIAALRKRDDVALGLLIGPQRPHDRAAFLDGPGRRLFQPELEGLRVVCVATQTFEVGIDADVEGLVTESASAAALVQRLGRLNRSGRRDGRATIVRDPGRWLYRDDEPQAWEWLTRRAVDETIDVSVAALATGESLPAPAKSRDAPLLSAETVDTLAQGGRGVGAWQEVDVEVYWRGAESLPSADVAVCWRADLRLDQVDRAATSYRRMLLRLAPPRAQELLTLTVSAARALVAAETFDERAAASASKLVFADADVGEETTAGSVPAPALDPKRVPFVVLRGRHVLMGARSRSNGEADSVTAGAIRAGDVIVLPARRTPRPVGFETFPRTDVAGDLEPADDQRLAPVRLTPEALATAQGGALRERTWCAVVRSCSKARSPAATPELLGELAGALPEHPGVAGLTDAAGASPGRRFELRLIGRLDDDDLFGEDESDGFVVAQEADADDAHESEPPGYLDLVGRPIEPAWVLVPATDRRVARSVAAANGGPPTLDAHARAVQRQLDGVAVRIGLPEPIRSALCVAALAHDHGKADQRIQAFYRHGVHVAGAQPIAKSEFGTDDPRAEALARARSGLPRRLRHEADSVVVLADAVASGRYALGGDVDLDLVLVLIQDHHGFGRALLPVPGEGAASRPYAVAAAGIVGSAGGEDQGSLADGARLDRFWSANQRYGPWGLAYLQSLLVLADRGVSSKGE